MNPKYFYQGYIADNILDALDTRLAQEVILYDPESVLEFGAGSGKNLKLIKSFNPNIETFGLDISILNVIQMKFNGVDCCICGDERHIPLRKFDVVLTCSVLDHIQEIENIIGHFQEIATKAIILAETNSIDDPEKFYYKHDYESYGFEKLDFEFQSDSDGCLYHIWVKKMPCVESR